MRIVLLADLHYGNTSHEGSGPFTLNDHAELAREAHSHKPDVVVVAGDVAETMHDTALLPEALALYKNPHGISVMVPGNHDVWYSSSDRAFNGEKGIAGAEAKYKWNLASAMSCGWQVLDGIPLVNDGVVIAGGMGWYDFSSSPIWLGMTPQIYEAERAWADYTYMGLRHVPDEAPMTEFCSRRMAEFNRCLASVPHDRKALIIVSHFVGFENLLGPLRDEKTAYFGNFSMGKAVVEARADLYYCGHTHSRAESMHGPTRCVNNGSQYGHGTKRCDVFEF